MTDLYQDGTPRKAPGYPDATEAALRDFLTVFDPKLYRYFSSLWDPKTGGFYISKSARDNDGFLPDIESTAQILEFLSFTQMVKDKTDLQTALPKEVVDKLIGFACSLESPDDGYFYHPQWGKNIPDSRRGRDLTWALGMRDTLGITFPYPTATERMKNGGKIENPPAYLESESKLFAHLEKLTERREVDYGWSNIVNAITGQIISAGLGKAAVNWLVERMDPKTGLWSKSTVDYVTVGTIMKTAPLFVGTQSAYPYPEATVRSLVGVAESSLEAPWVVFIYNPWCGIGAIRRTLGFGTGYTAGELNAYLAEHAPKMLEMSKVKMERFRRSDNSFSFFLDHAMSTTQGVPVGLGLADEGDVNSTKIALGSTLNSIETALGIPPFQVFADGAIEDFSAELMKKIHHQ